jgi:hypothetical protein
MGRGSCKTTLGWWQLLGCDALVGWMSWRFERRREMMELKLDSR